MGPIIGKGMDQLSQISENKLVLVEMICLAKGFFFIIIFFKAVSYWFLYTLTTTSRFLTMLQDYGDTTLPLSVYGDHKLV